MDVKKIVQKIQRVAEQEEGREESTNKSSGETMLLKVANCLALLLPGTAGWAREAVFHSPELINDPRREKRTYEALDALVKALYRCGCLQTEQTVSSVRSNYYPEHVNETLHSGRIYGL